MALCLVPGAGCQRRATEVGHGHADAMEATVGEATMLDDGTIVLDLVTGGATRGHARVTYAPSHPKYRDVLAHLGGMKPGERKAVPPWPDRIDDLRVRQAVQAWARGRGLRPGQVSEELAGTDRDGRIAVTVYVAEAGDAGRPRRVGLRLDPNDYSVVTELP